MLVGDLNRVEFSAIVIVSEYVNFGLVVLFPDGYVFDFYGEGDSVQLSFSDCSLSSLVILSGFLSVGFRALVMAHLKH